jgi:hypothetical protein
VLRILQRAQESSITCPGKVAIVRNVCGGILPPEYVSNPREY